MGPHSADSLEIASSNLDWQTLAGSTTMVTGAGGFLGSAIVQSLLARHDLTAGLEPRRVVAVVRNSARAAARLGSHRALEIVEQDLGLPIADLPPFDYLVHAASQASPRYYGTDPVGTMLPNVLGTQRLLEFARRFGANGFLFVSSAEVYGSVPAGWVPTEEHQFGYLDPTSTRSCYAESKRAGETLCVSHAHQYGLRALIVRPFHTYGPGIDLNDGRVFADFVRDIVEKRNIVLKSDGLARRAFCYVTDAVCGVLTALIRGGSGEAYNVGNAGNEISVRELADLLVRLFPERGLFVESATREDDSYLVSTVSRSSPNTDKLEALGWKPTVSVEDGFLRTVRGIELSLKA